MQQTSPLKFWPQTGKAVGRGNGCPTETAATCRKYCPGGAWLFNPWTGTERADADVLTDPFGLLILPPGEPLIAATTTKDGNPKDAVGGTKVPLAFLSPIAKAHWALAQHCGRVKYGAWNWREAGVRASVYISAIQRHADGYLSGEQHDPADGTHHLCNIMACCAILLEAEAIGNLVDDRPPRVDMRPTYEFVEKQMAVLTEKYKDRQPRHWTINDTPQEGSS